MKRFKNLRFRKQKHYSSQADSSSSLSGSGKDLPVSSEPSGKEADLLPEITAADNPAAGHAPGAAAAKTEDTGNVAGQREESVHDSSKIVLPDTEDTVWIPPDQAARILSGDQPLDEGIKASLLENRQSFIPDTKEMNRPAPEADSLKPVPEADSVKPVPEADNVKPLPEIDSLNPAPEADAIIYHRNPRKGRKNKVMGKIIFSLLGLLVIAYLGGRYFFQNHFFPNTYVDGTDLGLHSIDKAKEIMTSRLQAETLELVESDENEYLTGKEVGLHYISFSKVEEILKKQDAANWFLLLRTHTDYGNLDFDVDAGKLSDALNELHCMSPDQPKKPENAKIYYNPEKHRYMVQNETYGNIIDKDAFLQAVKNGFLSRSSSLSLQDQTYFVQADVKKDNEALQAARKTMNTWLKGIVKYRDGDLKLKLTRDEISGFIECSDDFKTSINKKKVKKYVENKVVKTFNSLDGDIPQGLTAWKVNEKEESEALIKDIKSGKKVTRTPVYASQGLAEGEYNLGNTYIDVNIPNQEMWYVENGKVVFHSDVVTGNISTGHGTSTGIYHIQYKQRDHMMVKYHSFVHYWMPYNTTIGVGFHDANWRSSFGGEIYRYDGSHGCINMPPAKAEELFDMISSGTVVYVHE